MKCSVPGCGNARSTSIQKKYHVFPADPKLCSQWVKAIRNPQFDPKFTTVLICKTLCLRVCSDHFRNDDYKGGQNNYYAVLNRGAIPTVFPAPTSESQRAAPTSLSIKQVRELERQLKSEVGDTGSVKGARMYEKRIKDLTIQSVEDKKLILRLQDMVDRLQLQVKTLKRKADDSEKMADAHHAKLMKTEQDLEDAEERADIAETQVKNLRAKSKNMRR